MSILLLCVSILTGNTVLLLDGANSLLNPGSAAYGQFVKALKMIMSINNQRLKVIVTSRYDIGMKAGMSSKVSVLIINSWFKQYEVLLNKCTHYRPL